MTAAVMAWALSRLAGGQRVVLASVVETAGSVPGKVGARLAMSMNQDWTGTVGGAGLEMKVLARCRELLTLNPTPYGEVLRFGLNKGAKGYEVKPLDSLCGGQVTLSIEVMIPMPHVLLMGKRLQPLLMPLAGNTRCTTHVPNLRTQPCIPMRSQIQVTQLIPFLPKKISNLWAAFQISFCSVMIGVKTKSVF